MSIKVKEGQSVTLDVAGAELTLAADSIARMWIDRLMPKATEPVAQITDVPQPWGKIGEATWGPDTMYAGIMRGQPGGADYHLFLVTTKPPSDMSWDDAMQWAEGLSDGATLPSRKEQALLFANLGDRLDKEWYWSNEQYAGVDEYAWFQHFTNGYQNGNHKSSRLRVVAVRRLPIE